MLFKSLTSNEFSLRKFDNIYMFLLLLYAGRSCRIVNALMYPTSVLSTLFFIGLTIILMQRHHFVFGKKYLWINIVLTLWVFLQIVKNGKIEPMTIFLYLEISIAYIVTNVYGKKTLSYFEKYTTWLAFVSLVVWVLYFFFPNLMLDILKPFNLRESKYIIKTTIIVTSISGTSSFLGMRNAGFCSEPGHYSSFLCIALVINLVKNKFNISYNKNKSFYVLFISLITTQSTTGYVGMGVVILFYVLNSKFVSKFVAIVLVILATPSIIVLPFMKEKIENYWYQEGNELEIADAADGKSYTYVPQRIDGLVLELYNIKNDPFLGYGVQSKNSYVCKKFSDNISLSNGVLQVFALYGIPVGILFYLGLCVSFWKLSLLKKFSGWYLLLVLYMTLSTSYNFTVVPFLLSVWQMQFFYERKRLYFVKFKDIKRKLILYFNFGSYKTLRHRFL